MQRDLADGRQTWRIKDEKLLTVRAFGGVMQCVAWIDPEHEEDEEA